jgi:Luciferase-like monooxygenase
MISMPAFGLNRFDYTSAPAFAADARRAESLGWNYAFIPSSPLRRQDPYVYLAFAAVQTERIGLGPLIENPIMRHPSVIASSIATVEALASGRTLLGYGVGDTAVRLILSALLPKSFPCSRQRWECKQHHLAKARLIQHGYGIMAPISCTLTFSILWRHHHFF